MKTKLIEYNTTENPGQLECRIAINELFESKNEKDRFFSKLPSFLESDPNNKIVYQVDNTHINYHTEELIPKARDNRPALLLLLGNPASHSVVSGMFFAFEANNTEHRFWKIILKNSGVLNVSISGELSPEEKNSIRRNQILESRYSSPFQIGLSVFISMPSGASDKWSGVAGIQKLIGIRALRRLEHEEKKRVTKTIDNFVTKNGAVVAFQKNAWENMKTANDPDYSREIVNKVGLTGKVDNRDINLICVPPTRLSGPCSRVLANLTQKYTGVKQTKQ
jgi:hypothetical protein